MPWMWGQVFVPQKDTKKKFSTKKIGVNCSVFRGTPRCTERNKIQKLSAKPGKGNGTGKALVPSLFRCLRGTTFLNGREIAEHAFRFVFRAVFISIS